MTVNSPQTVLLSQEGVSANADVGKKSISQETVQNLSRMIKDLEGQLERMLGINAAVERELENERKRRKGLEREVTALEEQVRRAEQAAAVVDDLKSEINYITNERSRLAATIEELGRHLAETEQENRRYPGQVERLRAERQDALEELQSVETQFERAMEMLADLRTRLAVIVEERDAIKGRMRLISEKLAETEEERDALLAEVEESRKALEEIRRSLADACVMSAR
jgi:chromosome segregation ATPase